MLELRLHAFIKENGDVLFRFSWPTRVLFFVIGVAILVSMFITGSTTVFGFVLVAIAIFGGLFEESWAYRAKERIFVHRSGLIFLARTRSFSQDDVEKLELRVFKRGRQGAPVPATVGGEPIPPNEEDEGKTPSTQLSSGEMRPRFGFPGMGGGRNPFSRNWILLAIHHKEFGRLIVEAHVMRHSDDLPPAARALAKTSGLILEELSE